MCAQLLFCFASLFICLFITAYSGGSRPSDKGGGAGHPDPEIRGGAVSKKFFWPFGPQFGLKIRVGRAGPSPGSATVLNINFFLCVFLCAFDYL